MTDYQKLTVVKLKEELKQRGLGQSGLKAALVARLVESDAHTTSVAEAEQPDSSSEPEDPSKADENGAQSPPAQNDIDSQKSHSPPPTISTEDVKAAVISDEIAERLPEMSVVEDGSNGDDALPVSTLEQVPQDDPKSDSAPGQAPHKNSKTNSTYPIDETSNLSTSGDLSSSAATLAQMPMEIESLKTAPSQTSPTTEPRLTIQQSADREEEVDDSRKRKRRSQSPAPSIDTIQKKIKAHDGSHKVRLPEDVVPEIPPEDEEMVEAPPLTQIVETNGEIVTNLEIANENSEDVPASDEELNTAHAEQENEAVGENVEPTSNEGVTAPTTAQAETLQSPKKATSPTDARFKGLFSAPSQAETSPQLETSSGFTDRDIAPSLHPATSALYIRNFMRPLHPGTLRTYLEALAKPSHEPASQDIITDYYLDTIRTHCLVRFSSTSAAIRVRSSLHDRVWPDERTRKPLWVDFVPEEKLSKWIEVEQAAVNVRGQPAKRWEVAYEQEDATITAYLQEAETTNGRPPAISIISKTENGVEALPRTPAGVRKPEEKLPPPLPTPTGDTGKGFQALDDLFGSTAAKPKLYYQPVKQAVADRRLDQFAAARGGGRSDEKRRYTFDEGNIVDKGAEFGASHRGGYRGRGGGYAGGYSGRGGGHKRGDRGDSWRHIR